MTCFLAVMAVALSLLWVTRRATELWGDHAQRVVERHVSVGTFPKCPMD